jgi:hypothetical protein
MFSPGKQGVLIVFQNGRTFSFRYLDNKRPPRPATARDRVIASKGQLWGASGCTSEYHEGCA